MTSDSIDKINSYVKVEFTDTSEKDLNVIKLKKNEINDDSLDFE